MNEHPPLPSEKDDAIAAFAIDAVRDGLSNGRFPGIDPEDPLVAALFEVLEHIDWPAEASALMQALPHMPEVFSLHDLQSTLARIGISSRVSHLGGRRLRDIEAPALLLDGDSLVGVLVEDPDGLPRIIDPVTRRTVFFTAGRRTLLVSFHKAAAPSSDWFVFDLFHRSRHLLLGLLGVKLIINLVTMLAAFSVFAIFDKVVATGATNTLLAIGFGMGAAFCVDFIYRFGKARLLARMSSRLEYLISALAFRQVISLPMDKLISSTVAQQIARLRPLNAMASAIAVPLIDVLSDIPFALLLSLLLFLLAGPIGFLPLGIFAVFAIAFGLLMPGIRRLEDRARRSAETHTQIMSDLIYHSDTIRLTGAQEVWTERARQAVRHKASAQRKAERAARNLALIGSMATPVVGGGTAIAGTALAMSGSLSTGGLIAAMILSWRIIAPMQTALLLVSKWSDMFRLSAQLNRLMSIPTEMMRADGAVAPSLHGDIAFAGVAYRYNGATDWALQGVSTQIPAGTLVAVTGPTGSGKTTFLRMIPALLQPMAGTVSIDGLNLRQLPIGHLRQTVCYVPFNSVLIHGTIAQNMRLSSPLASDAEIEEALRDVGLDKIIAELPEGIETRLTDEVQATLPKGFRQALAIAQALLGRPKVLLLDEPARALDPQLETAMLNALLARRGRMTIIMVTHRPSHVRAADLEIALLSGRISEGSHQKRKAS